MVWQAEAAVQAAAAELFMCWEIQKFMQPAVRQQAVQAAVVLEVQIPGIIIIFIIQAVTAAAEAAEAVPTVPMQSAAVPEAAEAAVRAALAV